MQHEAHETHHPDHGHAHGQHESGRSHVHAATAVGESEAIPPSLNHLTFSATLHCLTGCAIGEVLGMVIGTAFKWGNAPTIALSVALAFLFGYGLTMRPLLASGLTTPVVLKLAFASDTVSITIMEIVDNAIMLAIPGQWPVLGEPHFLAAGCWGGRLPGESLADRAGPGTRRGTPLPRAQAWVSFPITMRGGTRSRCIVSIRSVAPAAV